ncbi:MAG TPA: hypothetical protein VLY04_26325 [Bryobacteraceae bacterium]|nr:hypothetical protein [Bryobacteraceae bacterium]
MRPTMPGGVPAAVPAADSASAENVRLELERALVSGHFKNSTRCQTLFRYLVERTLAGDGALLKERVIGVEVFGRVPDYDTSEDPVVRTTAAEIRKKLAQFYQEQEHAGELRIELHPGSYVPEFRPPEVAAPPAPQAVVARPRLQTPKKFLIAGGAVAVLAAVWFLLPLWQTTGVDRFWNPMMTAPGGVLFCLGQPRTYNLYSDAKQRDLEQKIEGLPRGSLQSSKETIPLNQLVPMWDRYLALGDTMCLLRLVTVFEKRGKPYSIRGGASTSFSDLREHPAILIGAFDNEWTLRAVGQLRYTFYKDFQGLEVVRDRDHPEKSDWKLINSWPYWEIANDYAIVSRVFDRTTDRMVVIAAGITHFGTAAAGEFLSNPAYFADAIAQLPGDWNRRNLQIVLSVPVVHGAGGRPRVLATHVW